jgi:hypothetical protein
MAIKKIAIIGAGIFGCSIALELDKEGFEVVLFEREDDIMLKATKNNHNRIHYGYHYPRSLETTKQSLDGMISFLSNYSEAILFGFKNYYSIAKENSLVSAMQFKEFCKEAGISYKVEFPDCETMNPDLIAESYLVEEPIYDWTRLHSIVKSKIAKSNIQLNLNSDFLRSTESFDFVINCTYSNINEICRHMSVQELNFNLQDVIIPVFKSYRERVGLTVMDGPFCSVMPKGFEENKFLLYHAKYSVIESTMLTALKMDADIKAHTKVIMKDAINYFPFLKDAEVVDCWRSQRAIPISNNDQRLSEIMTYKDNVNFITVFSGKVTTAVKIAKQINVGLHTGYFKSHIYI